MYRLASHIKSAVLLQPRALPTATRAMSSANPQAGSVSSADAQSQNQSDTPKKQLALPEVPADSTNPSTQLNVNGPGVKLDHLGPMVVNQDGTLSRISNWNNMAAIEQQNTIRIIGKRNQQRLEALRAQQGSDSAESA